MDDSLAQRATGERPETGPMQFGTDWPGVFIRGDNAIQYAFFLKKALGTKQIETVGEFVLSGLVALLESCQVGVPNPVASTQRMVDYKQAHLDEKTEFVYWTEVATQREKGT